MGDHTEKAEVRNRIKQAVLSLPPASRERLSGKIIRQLQASPAFCSAKHVLAFASLPDEVNLDRLLSDGRSGGEKAFYLPRVKGDELEICSFDGAESLKQGAFRINEPQGAPLLSLDLIDLVIVPGVAFTPEGLRLGRGRGYYDRLLSRQDLAGAYKVGICFPCQLVAELPIEAHDIQMDSVITIDRN